MDNNWNDQPEHKVISETTDAPIVIDIEENGEEDEAMQVDTDNDNPDALLMEEENGGGAPDSQDSNELDDGGGPSTSAASTKSDIEEAKLKKMLQTEIEQHAKFKTFKTFSDSERLFPDVRVSAFHAVLFQLPTDSSSNNQFAPHASRENKWGAEYVPLPFDPEDKVTVRVPSTENEEGFVHQRVPIWDLIGRSLQDRVFRQCQDIEDAIRAYFKNLPTLNVLQYTIEQLMTKEERSKLFSTILPEMVKHCLQLPALIKCPLPLLRRFRNYSISMHQLQIASLLANAFFCTFRERVNEAAYPSINFFKLFSCDPDHPKFQCRAQKTRCILHYFERIVEEAPNGVVTFTRKSVKLINTPAWDKSDKKVRNLAVLCEGTIEDTGRGMLQVDFANRFVGGGVLGGGAVQEEILFVIYPELLISRLLTENLTANEALVVTGCERYCSYSGYASGFQFAGTFFDTTPCDPRRRKRTQIIAIDALYLTKPVIQYHPKNMVRELNKAFVGFNAHARAPSAAVATGKWGCGAFNGDPQLKGIIQLLASSQVDKDLVYFTFGDMNLQESLVDMFTIIKDLTVGQVWNLLKQYHQVFCTSNNPSHSLSEFFQEYFVSTLPMSEPDNMNGSERALSTASAPNPPIAPKVTSIPTRTSLQSTASAPCSSGATPILESVESSKFSNWLSNLDSFKASMKRVKKTKEEVLSFDDPEPAKNSALTDDQILNVLDTDTAATGIAQNGEHEPTPGSSSASSSPASSSKVKRRNGDENEEPFPASSKKIASTNSRQIKLKDFYKKQ